MYFTFRKSYDLNLDGRLNGMDQMAVCTGKGGV